MANNLHFEYSLSVNEKQTQQNLATFIKKTFGTDKNAKLSVPIKLDISTNLTNMDLKSIQDQLDKQFKGKLNLHATVKIDSSNVARQAQAELDRISKGLSLKVGLEVDPSAMKLMLGTVDVIKTLNKEVTKVKDNLKDLGKKIEININGAQINNVYDGALKTAEKIQKVNAQTTEEINEQLAMTKEQLAHQKKLAEEKKKELDIEKEKQANNKKIEESNKKIRQQQQQLNKELKNVEAQINAEKKKAEVLDQQAKKQKSTAKAQEDATKKIEKSTEKLVELEKQRADNQAYLNSKRAEEKQLLTNIELNKQEISLLRTKIKEMERLGKATTTVTKKVSGRATTSSTPKKPTKSRTSKTVVQVDTPVVQATVQATNAVNELENAEKQVTATIEKQADTKVKAIDKEIKAQDKLVQHTEDSAKKIEAATNRSYRAEDSKRKLHMPNGKDKIYNKIAGSEFASSLAGYRIHDVTSAEEQNEYELVLLNTLVKSRNVLTDFNIELKEGVALTEEQVNLIEERIRLIQKEMVDTKELAGAKDKANRQPFNNALKAFLANPNDEELGSKLDFQAEKVSKIGAMYKYQAALLKEKNRLEDMLGVKIKENAEVEAKRLEMETKRDERATGIRAKTIENQSNRALNKNIYKDAGDFLKEEIFGFEAEQLDDVYEEYYEELAEQADALSEAIGEKFNFAKQGQVNYEELDRYFKTIAKKTEEWKEQMASASDADKKKLQDNIEYAEEDVKYLKMLANSITTVNYLANVKSDSTGEYFDVDNIEEATEAIQSFADPKLVSKVRTQAENFDLFIKKTHALNEQTHQVKGEVLAMLAYFDRLNKSTDATNENWEELANRLIKYSEVLGKTVEEIDEFAIAEKNRDKKAEEAKSLMKATIKQGREYVKQLQQQMSTMDRETEAWEKRNKAINVFKQLVKDESISKEKMEEQVLGLYNLLNTKEKDSGDFKESKNNIKIVRQQAKAEEDIVVKYEKQANALYQILKLKKEGKKVSFDINKLIDSEGRGWKKIAEEQEKSYKKMKPHMIDFEFQNVDMHTKFANGDTSNIFDPTSYMNYDEDSIKTTEDMIKVLSEFSAKAYLLAELQDKMKTHKPMQNGRANLDIANKTTQAKIEEAQAMDAITAKQKEQIKNEQIHQKWLEKQELAKDKEPYLKASKEIIKRIKGSTKYKNNKDDDKFMKSVQQTFMYIDNLKHSEATLQQTIDAFEQLKTYAHETFNMKNETIQKLVEPFVGIKEETKEIKQELDKTDKNMDDVAKKADQVNQATQEQAQAESKITQQVEAQAQAQSKAKDDAKATAEAMESQAKSQKTITDELRKRLVEATSEDFVSKIPSEMLEKMYQGVDIAVAKGIKLTKTKIKDIIAVSDGLNQLDYSKVLGERGALVASGRKKKDGVFINRTDAYKAQKEAMDKQVDELEKPLLEIFKIMEKDLKGTVDKVKKEVKKKEPTQNKTKEINKTKQEQNKLVQQQVQVENNLVDVEQQRLQIAREIVKARELDKEYVLDINSLVDEQGRKWQDIAKTYEKDHMKLQHDILYQAYENTDMTRVYDMGKQGDSLATGKYVNNDEWSVKLPDKDKARLLSEYEAKNELLEPIRKLVQQLEMESTKAVEEVKEQVVQQEKVETSLYDQIQAIEKMTNAQKRFNAILELTGYEYDDQYEKNMNFYNYKSKTTSGQRAIKQRYTYLDNLGKNSDDPYDIASYNLPSLNSKNLTKNNRYSKENLGLLSTYSVYEEALEAFKNLKNSVMGNPNIEKEVEKVTQATDNIIENEQKQVTIQEQIVQAKQDEVKVEKEITSEIQKQLNEIDKLTGVERVKAMEEFMLGIKSDEISQNPKRGKYYTLDYFMNNAFDDLKRARTSPEAIEEIIVTKLDMFLNNALKNKDVAHLFDFDKFKGVYSPEYDRNYMFNNKDTLFKKQFTMEETDSGAFEKMLDQRLEALEMMSTYEGLKLFFAKFSKVYNDYTQTIAKGTETTTNALEKESEVTKQITNSIQEQVDAKEQSNDAKKEENNINEKQINKEEQLLNLENKRKQILSSIKYTKEDMLSDGDLERLKEDLELNKEKTKELKAQGETAKFLAKIAEDAEEGGKAKLANKRLSEIFKSQTGDYSKYGITDTAKFIKEQKQLGVLTNEAAGLKEDIKIQEELNNELVVFDEELKAINQKIEELNTNKKDNLQLTQDTVNAHKEEAKAIKESVEDLKTLEEYQKKYAKEQSGMAGESFDTDTNLAVYNNKFSTESIGQLETMMEMFRLRDGGVMPSYKGMGLPAKVLDSLGLDKVNELLAEYAIRFHEEFQKYVQDSYMRMSYARDLAEKGENIENDHYFQKMTKAMEEFKARLMKDALKLIDDISKSEASVFMTDGKYDDLADYRLMEGDKGHRVYMSDTGISSHANDQVEILANQEKELQAILQTQVAQKQIAVDQANITEDKKEELEADKQLVEVKKQESAIVSNMANKVEETKEEVEVLNKFVEKGNEDWYKTYQYLSRVVEASSEFAKANRLAKEEWEELKEEADMSETDDQWKEMVKRVYDFANELGVAFKTEKGLYDQRKQALKDINILTASAEEIVAKSLTMESKDGESDRTYGSLDETLDYNKAKLESLGISEKQIEATNKEAKAENELAKAKNETANATDKVNKAKEKSNKTSKASKPKQSDTDLGEMISIPKSTNKRDYIDGTLNAIKKVMGSSTFKKYAINDASLKDAINALDKEAKVNKSSGVGIDYWEGLIKRLKELGAKGHIQGTTIDNMLIPYIGGEIPKSKANKAVKDKAASLGTTSKETVDDAKKIETSTVNTAKAQNDVAKATKVVKVDTNEVAKSTDVVKQNIAETTESLDDLKDIIVSDADINALFDSEDESDEAKLNKLREQAIQAAEANKDYAKQLEEQEKSENKKASSSEKVVETKKEENKVEQQILETKEEEQNVVDNIADTQKEIVVITEQANEINQEELQAMKDELNAKEKLGAEQKAQLQTLKNEIKEGEKKEKAINKSIEQENKMIGKMQEKIALAQDAEETARKENEERVKQKAELEAHIKLLQQQADEKRQAIALLESEVEYTEDNTFQIKQLTKEYDKLQENISETQARVDDLTDAYYEQQEQARKANNEASQQMMDEYMKRIEQEDEIRRKESDKYLPPISGEVGEYKGGGDGGGNIPPSGGSDESSINAELSDRIKLRQRELMLQLQQIIHNKDLSDEQKMGVQILAEQVLEIGQLASSMKDLNWLTQNVKENMKEFKFSVKVDDDNKKELAKIAEEERKELTNMYASLFDEIDANEKLKAEKQSLEELIALYKEKTLAQVDEYSSKNSGYVDQDRVAELRTMIQYMEQNISSAGEYEQVIRQIGNVFRELKFDTNQTKHWYKMEESAEKARVAKEKEAKAQEELNKKVQDHIKVKKEQADLYAREILMSKTMQKATEEERMAMESLIRQYDITGSSIQEVNQSYAQMQRLVKDMKLDVMNRQLMEQDTWLDKVKNGIKDYVRFTLDLDDIQGVMQNVTRLFSTSFEHIKVLDEAYTNINQTMSVTTEEFESMAQTAYEVGDASGALGTDILEMMKIYSNANETAESVNAKIAGTTAFQNVSGLSGTDATNALQTIINQFKLVESGAYSSADAITYVGDAITGVAYNLSKDEGDAMQEIISAVEDAGSVIAQAGGSLEWYSAVTGTLAETVNATGSEVGGAMRMITARTLQQKEAFDELNDSGEETEVAMANAEKALTSLGISIRGSDGDLRSIEEVLGDVAAKWDTLSDSDQQFVAEKLAGTNRRSYFMALMENYQRVIDLQDMSMQSEGVMMEASEKHAESLTGKLNQLTNAKEKFYQTILNSDALKVGTQGLTDLLNSVTKVAEYMDGKWITAIGGATGALIAFKMARDGLTFGDFIKGLGTTILKFAGLEAGAITATGALTALKSVLLGIAGGAVLAVITGGIVALVNSMKSAEEQIEETRGALENYKATMADVENDSASLQGMQMKVDKMKELNTTLDDQARLAREVNDELASHADSYGSIEHILRNENIALQDRLDLLDKEIEKRGEIARQAALEALNGKDMFGFGDNVYDNLVEDLDPIMGEFLNAQNGINKASMGGLFAPSTEQIDSYYELWEDAESRLQALYEQGAEQYSLAQKYFEEGIINEEDMAYQTELYEQFVDDLLLQVQRVSGETGSSIALDMFEFGDPLNPMVDPTQSLQEQNAYYVEQVELLETLKGLYNDVQDGISGAELSNVFNSDVMKDFTGDITKTEDVMAHLGQKIAETENELDALGATSHNIFNEQEKDVAELQKEYIDACKAIEEIEGYVEQIGDEGGVSADMMATLFDAGLLDGYTGALNDAGAIQEHLTSKIAESEAVARQAYLNMMKDDADFWAQKMANSEAWREHESIVQQDIIGIMANSLGVQAEDFSSFIDSKGGMRAVDYTNASTMAEAENTMQSSLATQVLGYAAQLINSKAGYRQTDMSNVNEFLNSQGVAEARTVQELATMWADFYNAKVAAINNTMSEINSQIAAGWTDDQIAAMDGWFGDGSLRAKQTELNKLQNQIKTLAATNLTMTNFFAGLDTYFNGAGGGVGQSTVGGGKIGGGGGGSSWKPTSTGGSGYKPSGGSGGSGGSGSGYKPSSGSGSGGSGSGTSKQEVEDMEAEIDRYYELNDAINDNEKAISQLQSKRESITTKSAYKKSIEQEVALLNSQIQAYKNLQKEQKKERNEIKKTLSKNGFKFDKNGDISNYATQVKKLQNQANKKTGTKKEQAIENVEYLIDLIERYSELHSDAIPETTIEILDLQTEIQELNKDLAENMKNIEKLGDRYFRVAQAMNDVTDAIEMNQAKQEHADEEEKIKLMEQEIDLIKQQQKINRDNKKVAEGEAKELRKQLEESGVKFNENGNISNYEVLIGKMEKDANKLVGQAQEDAVTEIEDLLELIEQYVTLTDDTIPELDQAWQEYANNMRDIEEEIQDMYKAHQETAVQTQKDIASAYEHYLTKRYDKLKEALNDERDLYNDSYEAENFQRQLSEEQRTLDEIAQQIAIYERDTSVVGRARIEQLRKEYEEQQKAINDMIRDNEHQKTNEAFDDAQESLDDELAEILSPENLVKTVNDAIASGFITVGDEVMTLDSLMATWIDETGDGLYALGDVLKSELIDNLTNAQKILSDMGITSGFNGSVSLASSNAFLAKAMTSGGTSSSADIKFEAPLLYVEGNVDENVMDKLTQALKETERNIYSNIAKGLQLK